MNPDAADAWWQSLPDERRVQIHRWVDPPAAAGPHTATAGQYELPITKGDHPQ